MSYSISSRLIISRFWLMMCFWNDWNGMFGMSWKSLHVFMPSSIAFSFAVRKLLHNHQQLIDHEYGSPA